MPKKQDNPHNRKTDSTGRIIPTREAYAKEIRELLVEWIPVETSAGTKPLDEVSKALAQYTAEQAYKDYKDNTNFGIQLGHKDVITMLKTAMKQAVPMLHVADEKTKKLYSEKPEQAVPVAELQAVIKAVAKAGKETTDAKD